MAPCVASVFRIWPRNSGDRRCMRSHGRNHGLFVYRSWRRDAGPRDTKKYREVCRGIEWRLGVWSWRSSSNAVFRLLRFSATHRSGEFPIVRGIADFRNRSSCRERRWMRTCPSTPSRCRSGRANTQCRTCRSRRGDLNAASRVTGSIDDRGRVVARAVARCPALIEYSAQRRWRSAEASMPRRILGDELQERRIGEIVRAGKSDALADEVRMFVHPRSNSSTPPASSRSRHTTCCISDPVGLRCLESVVRGRDVS